MKIGEIPFGGIAGLIIVIAVLTILPMWGCPHYKVYQKTMDGVGALREAESSRQIAVAEARAKEESAKLLAQAEVERAKGLAQAEIERAGGVAKANEIIGQSLKDNEYYLRYLWITSLAEDNNPTVVYIPTELGLPVLEANRLK